MRILLPISLWIGDDEICREALIHCGCVPGGSSGASVDAAVRAAHKLKAGQKCVVILPDTIRNYMTKFLDDNWLAERDIIKLDVEEKLW